MKKAKKLLLSGILCLASFLPTKIAKADQFNVGYSFSKQAYSTSFKIKEKAYDIQPYGLFTLVPGGLSSFLEIGYKSGFFTVAPAFEYKNERTSTQDEEEVSFENGSETRSIYSGTGDNLFGGGLSLALGKGAGKSTGKGLYLDTDLLFSNQELTSDALEKVHRYEVFKDTSVPYDYTVTTDVQVNSEAVTKLKNLAYFTEVGIKKPLSWLSWLRKIGLFYSNSDTKINMIVKTDVTADIVTEGTVAETPFKDVTHDETHDRNEYTDSINARNFGLTASLGKKNWFVLTNLFYDVGGNKFGYDVATTFNTKYFAAILSADCGDRLNYGLRLAIPLRNGNYQLEKIIDEQRRLDRIDKSVVYNNKIKESKKDFLTDETHRSYDKVVELTYDSKQKGCEIGYYTSTVGGSVGIDKDGWSIEATYKEFGFEGNFDWSGEKEKKVVFKYFFK